jgi:hypothetical protein
MFRLQIGLQRITAKIIDNQGLENIEIIKLKINGTIERS